MQETPASLQTTAMWRIMLGTSTFASVLHPARSRTSSGDHAFALMVYGLQALIVKAMNNDETLNRDY